MQRKLTKIDFQFENVQDRYKIIINSRFKFSTELHKIILKFTASLILYNCTSFQISETQITANAGVAGLAGVNILGHSNLTQLTIKVNCSHCPKNLAKINGFILHYNNLNTGGNMIDTNFRWTNTTIKNFSYHIYKSCPNTLHYAINATISQQYYNSYILFEGARFDNLKASSILYYHVNTCKSDVQTRLFIRDFVVAGNIGIPQLRMFHIVLYNTLCSDDLSLLAIKRSAKQYNQISFKDCQFLNNRNMDSIIFVEPASSQAITSYMTIRSSEFLRNINVHLVNVETQRAILWQITHFTVIGKTRIHSNINENGKNLISVTNGTRRAYICFKQ